VTQGASEVYVEAAALYGSDAGHVKNERLQRTFEVTVGRMADQVLLSSMQLVTRWSHARLVVRVGAALCHVTPSVHMASGSVHVTSEVWVGATGEYVSVAVQLVRFRAQS
jgi:hypothetical protein